MTPASRPVSPHAVTPRVVTVGFFDGMHLGHQRLLGELKRWAAELGAEPAVVTFDRHPQEVLRGRGPPPILSLRHRLLRLVREKVAVTLVLDFTRELSLLSPEDFARRICLGGLGARGILFGFDSAFGQGRRGTYEYLSARARALGLAVRQAPVERLAGERVSSTLVREALLEGDLERLEMLLGRTFSVLGKVVQGDGRGRSLGFPTANLDVEGSTLPPAGVYFTEVRRLGGPLSTLDLSPDSPRVATDLGPEDPGPEEASGRGWLGALANVGKRPTFNDPALKATVEWLEVHIPGFSGDLYGACLELRFLRRLRPERKFGGAAELVRQIQADLEAFRAFRALHGVRDVPDVRDIER